MFQLFKKQKIEPSYSKEGETLFKLLSNKDEWIWTNTGLENKRLGIYVRNYYKHGFYWVTEVAAYNEKFVSDFFTRDDQSRLVPTVEHLVDYLESKNVRKILNESGCCS